MNENNERSNGSLPAGWWVVDYEDDVEDCGCGCGQGQAADDESAELGVAV